MRRQFSKTQLLFLALLQLGYIISRTNAQSCCINTDTGLNFTSCVCPGDNIAVQTNTTGASSHYYHWVFSESPIANVAEDQRGNLTVQVSPCKKASTMSLLPASPSSWSLLALYNSTESDDVRTITVPIRYTEFMTQVNVSEAASYEVTMYTSLARTLAIGVGNITGSMAGDGSVNITFPASPTASASYKALWVLAPNATDPNATPTGCAHREGKDPKLNPMCIFWTACGAEAEKDGATDWITVAAGGTGTFAIANLKADSYYLFNVLMKDTTTNLITPIGATELFFELMTYQSCVGSATCQSQGSSDMTIQMTILLCVVLFLLLVGTLRFIYHSMHKRMHNAAHRGSTFGETTSFGATNNGRVNRPSALHLNIHGLGDIMKKPPSPSSPSRPLLDESPRYIAKSSPGSDGEEDSYNPYAAAAAASAGQESPRTASVSRSPVGSPRSSARKVVPVQDQDDQEPDAYNVSRSQPPSRQQSNADAGGDEGGGGRRVRRTKKKKGQAYAADGDGDGVGSGGYDG